MAWRELDAGIELHPKDVRLRFWLAELALMRFRLLGQSEPLIQAISRTEEGLLFAPRRHDLRLKKAEIQILLRDYRGAVETVRITLLDWPSEEGYRLLLAAHRAAGEAEDAARVIREAEHHGFRID